MAVIRHSISLSPAKGETIVVTNNIYRRTPAAVSGQNYSIYDLATKGLIIAVPAKTYIDKIDLNVITAFAGTVAIAAGGKLIPADLYDEKTIGIYSLLIGRYFPDDATIEFNVSAASGKAIVTILKGTK